MPDSHRRSRNLFQWNGCWSREQCRISLDIRLPPHLFQSIAAQRHHLMNVEPADDPIDHFHMTNGEAETALRRFLLSRGFSLSDELNQNGATGPDLIATSPSEQIYYIEVIGYKKTGPARSRDFYEGVFRALARVRLGARKVVLACPFTFQDGLDQRVKYLGEAWLRLGSSFPELELWFIYPRGTMLSYASWNYWGSRILDPPKIIDWTAKTSCRFGPPVNCAAKEFHERYERKFQ